MGCLQTINVPILVVINHIETKNYFDNIIKNCKKRKINNQKVELNIQYFSPTQEKTKTFDKNIFVVLFIYEAESRGDFDAIEKNNEIINEFFPQIEKAIIGFKIYDGLKLISDDDVVKLKVKIKAPFYYAENPELINKYIDEIVGKVLKNKKNESGEDGKGCLDC